MFKEEITAVKLWS